MGTINVIFARPMGDVGTCSRVISMVRGFDLEDRNQAFKKTKMMVTPTLSFSKEDKEGTF